MDNAICPHCGSWNVDVEGAISHGDADYSDECTCLDCGETFEINTRWFDNQGNEYATQEEMWAAEMEESDGA